MHWQIIVLVFGYPIVVIGGFYLALSVEDWSYVLSQIIQIITAIVEAIFHFFLVIGGLSLLGYYLYLFWIWVNNYLNII